jgi:hypothetical protein
MKLQGLLNHVRRWFRGLPAVPDEADHNAADAAGDVPPPQIGVKKSADDSWFGRVTAAEQREWQELVASADLGARLSDTGRTRRREHRTQRRRAAR